MERGSPDTQEGGGGATAAISYPTTPKEQGSSIPTIRVKNVVRKRRQGVGGSPQTDPTPATHLHNHEHLGLGGDVGVAPATGVPQGLRGQVLGDRQVLLHSRGLVRCRGAYE